MTDNCNRPLSRAARQLFRQDASHILLHYFGSSRNAPWRREGSEFTSDNLMHSSQKENDGYTLGRRTIPLVDNPKDGLSDEEWFQLLAYAIENSAQYNNNQNLCPLHPKHDMYLKDDLNSFVVRRRYKYGTKNFGGLSLPLAGRVARTLLWLEERGMYHSSSSAYNTESISHKNNRRYLGSSIHLFECGHCGKTFASRYYLDKHMDMYHPHIPDTDNAAEGSSEMEVQKMICPSEHLCEPLGGISACVDIMNRMTPFYGPGTMLGKEYVDSNRESSFSSSLHSLIEHFHKLDSSESGDNNDDEQVSDEEMPQKYNGRVREGSFSSIAAEIRHRSLVRNKLLSKVLLMEKHNQESSIEEDDDNIQEMNDWYHMTTATCDNEEMERLFNLCQEMITDCFGDDDSPDSRDHHVNLVHDLTEQICQPLHCHHRLHRMAGHSARHMIMWNDEWDEHHSYSLGLFGWLVILGLAIFYGCAFVLGLGSEGDWGSNILPSNRRIQQKKKSS